MVRKNTVAYLDGADELNRALKSVGDRASGLLLRKAGEAGARVIVDEARRLAPKKSGALAEGITAEVARVQVGRVQVNIGYSRKTWYGRLIEQGTKFIAARPFLRPALDAKASEAQEAVSASLRASLRDVL
jgi:HK97 gp10 family phage protein